MSIKRCGCAFLFLSWLFGVASQAQLYFSTYFINNTIFGGGGELLYTKCVFRFTLQMLPEKCLILRRIHLVLFTNPYMSSCKAPLTFVRF